MQKFVKIIQPSHVGIHRKALVEHYQMSTHLPGFQSFFRFLHHFVLAKLATSSVRVKDSQTLPLSVIHQSAFDLSHLNQNTNIKKKSCNSVLS